MPKVSTIFIASTLLVILLARYYIIGQNASILQNGQHVSLSTTLLQEPTLQGKFQRFRIVQNDGTTFLVMTSQYPQYHYGDHLLVVGTIKGQDEEVAGKRSGFLLLSEKPIFTMFFPHITAEKNHSDPLSILVSVTSWFRTHTVSLFEATLPPNASSLLLGIVFGIKQGMAKEFTQSLQQVGVVHVIAASGMNVTMVAAFLASLFSFFFRRQVALVASIAGILFYGFLSGFESSITRASIMAIMAFSAQIMGRQNKAIYALFLAGYVMLLISPFLILDIGFQLSFASTLGLVILSPLLAARPPLQKLLDRSLIGQDVATTITAQLATLPILLANFGTYSLWSVVVNGLVLWVVPILMILGGLAAIVGMVLPLLGQILLYLTLPFLLYFERVVSFFSQKGGILSVDAVSWPLVLGYYCLLFALVFFFSQKQGKEKI